MLPGSINSGTTDAPVARRVDALMPADVILLGEQHDAADHHRIERETVEALVAQGKLAALAIEMAEEGGSTAKLPATATEAQVQDALKWNDKAWGWDDYGPAIMVAVRAGVPVVGANLPLARIKDAMADVSLDAQLSNSGRETQQAAVRAGHCDLLPESQIGPMTRVQIARDRSMAQAIVKVRQPGKTVLLISGAGHATKTIGVAQHLPTDLSIKAIQLQAGGDGSGDGGGSGRAKGYDAIWQTPALPEKDYCASLRKG
ncbi:MAG: hypothetical protein JWQ73_2559 [Variovorax sp.]|nr:hypothetical protein [Variovorax sp.]